MSSFVNSTIDRGAEENQIFRENNMEKFRANLENSSAQKEKIFCEDSMEKFHENNIEIFRKAFGNSHYFVKAGRQGLVSKNEEYAGSNCQPDLDRLYNSSSTVAKKSHEGHFSKKKIQPNQHGLSDDTQFRENVEIFRRAFGESHYIVRADHDFARVSHLGISSKGSSAQSGKFSECVQKANC